MVGGIYNQLLETLAMRELNVPKALSLGKAADEDLGNEDFEWKWDPRFVVRATEVDGVEDTRLIGHAEYIGGRPGALSWAVQEQVKNSWGSLRCVLGELLFKLLLREKITNGL